MLHRSPLTYLALFIAFFLLSCGGGSTVTAVSLQANPAQVDVSGRSEITATSESSIADNVLGEKVTFSIRHNETGSELDVVTDRLDANGQAKAIYRAGTRQGVDIIEASFSSGARATVTITVGSGVVVGSLTLEVTGNVIRASVRDTRGALVPGVTVSFSATQGTLSPASGTTNNDGFLETTISDIGVSSTTVYASAGGITQSIRVGGDEPRPNTLSLTQNGDKIWALVRDGNGAGISGIVVNFGINVGSITATATTNDNGVAEATVTWPEGSQSGDPVNVRATATGMSATRTFYKP